MKKRLFSATLLLSFLFLSVAAQAEVVINGTRVIFNSKDNERVVQLKNNAKHPLLVQVWLDTGDPDSRPGEVSVPFVITPPVVRMDADKGQALRILKSGADLLPRDRESLFWFNLLEIPPKPTKQTAVSEQLIQITFRTRIKLFYRPDNLTISLADAYKRVKFSLPSAATLKVRNETPYFITFSKIEIKTAKNTAILASVDKFPERMVAPGGELILPLAKKGAGSLAGASVFYTVINDYGGDTVNEQILGNHI